MQDHRPELRNQAYGSWGKEPLTGHYYNAVAEVYWYPYGPGV